MILEIAGELWSVAVLLGAATFATNRLTGLFKALTAAVDQVAKLWKAVRTLVQPARRRRQ